MSDKVRAPAAVTAIIGALFMVLAALGVELPAGINEDIANEAAGAVILLISLIQSLVGFFVSENNPAPSGVAAALEKYT